MIKIGIDTVEIQRFSDMKNSEQFLKRNFTKRESDELLRHKNPAQHIAGAFAAKEAFSKYLGSGIRAFKLCDIEVLHDKLGKPYIVFKGEASHADVSISHSRISATAVVCGIKQQEYINASLRDKYNKLLPVRFDTMHKGDCGRVFVLAGSLGMTGAACLCTKATLRCGSGLVTLGIPSSAQPIAASILLEAMTLPLPCTDRWMNTASIDIIKNQINKSDACAIGPGLGTTDDIRKIVKSVLCSKTPCVIDADALNVISEDLSILKNKSCEAVITPHMGEMARLTKLDVSDIENNRAEIATDFAKEYNCTVVLKGHKSVIASPNGDYTINCTGNSGMASGGMGDVLTGVITSFVGQGLNLYDAAVLGVFLHGLAADIATEKTGVFGLIASDVIEHLPMAINYIS